MIVGDNLECRAHACRAALRLSEVAGDLANAACAFPLKEPTWETSE